MIVMGSSSGVGVPRTGRRLREMVRRRMKTGCIFSSPHPWRGLFSRLKGEKIEMMVRQKVAGKKYREGERGSWAEMTSCLRIIGGLKRRAAERNYKGEGIEQKYIY